MTKIVELLKGLIPWVTRRAFWIMLPIFGMIVAMALHSALLTGVFELLLIIVIGVWVTSVFGNKDDSFGFEPDNSRRSEGSYLERDQEYLQEQSDAVQQEHEERHEV